MMMNNVLNALFIVALVFTFVFGAELGVKAYVALQTSPLPAIDVGQVIAERL